MPCVYLSSSFPLQHMYAPDDISSIYGRTGTRLSPTLAAFVNGVAVSINSWNRWLTIVASTLDNFRRSTPINQTIAILYSVWATNKRTPHYPSAEISKVLPANIAWLQFPEEVFRMSVSFL